MQSLALPVPLVYSVNFDNPELKPEIDLLSLGPIVPGVSRYPSGLFPSAVVTTLEYKNSSPKDPGGVRIPVQHTNGDIASRTFYLPLPKAVGQAGVLMAHVVFDTPDVFTQAGPTAPEVPAVTKWAVGLNFKDGNEDDLVTDTFRIGATCHFDGDSHVTLKFTNTTDPPPPDTTYAVYRAKRTSFQMTVRVVRTLNDGTGEARLQVGSAPAQQGALNGITPQTFDSASYLEQVGIAVVCVNPTEAIVRVRLQSFKLWMLS